MALILLVSTSCLKIRLNERWMEIKWRRNREKYSGGAMEPVSHLNNIRGNNAEHFSIFRGETSNITWLKKMHLQ